MKRVFLILGMLMVSAGFNLGTSQTSNWSKEDRALLVQADIYWESEESLRALPLYDSLLTHHPADSTLKYKTGLCFLQQSSKRRRGLQLLTEVEESKGDFPELSFHLGRAYHYLYDFKSATAAFKKYRSSQTLTPEREKEVIRYLEYCKNGQIAIDDIVVVTIELLEPPSSLAGSEYVPLITPDESLIMFTYLGPQSRGGRMNTKGDLDQSRGKYYEDIFFANRKDTSWFPPQSIGTSINTFGHDAAIALSPDGQQLLIYKSDRETDEDIFFSNLQGAKWSHPEPLKGDINTAYWEGSASLTSDGCVIYFASDRPGGYGGRDLYSAELQDNGSWKYVKNLGPEINTELNEDSPFIHPDNQTLYFSSEGHNSMGGYDIFYSYEGDTSWAKPINIRYPVNTTEDDRFFVMSADGKRGYFSSARADQGNQHDIFIASFEERVRPTKLVELAGYVRLDRRPLEAKIFIRDITSGNDHAPLNSNAETGHYAMYLEPGHEYYVRVEIPGQPPKVEHLVVDEVNGFVQIKADFEWVSGKLNLPPNQQPAATTLQERFNTGMVAEKVRLAEEEQEKKKSEGMPGAGQPEDIGLALEVVLSPEQMTNLSPKAIAALEGAERRVDDQGKVRYRFRGLANKEALNEKKTTLAKQGLSDAEFVTVLEISPQAVAAARAQPKIKGSGSDMDTLLGQNLEIIVPAGEKHQSGLNRLDRMPNLAKSVDEEGNYHYQLGSYTNPKELASVRNMLDGYGLDELPITAIPGQEPVAVAEGASTTPNANENALLGLPLAMVLSPNQVRNAGAENLESLSGHKLEQDEEGQYYLPLGPFSTVNELAATQASLTDLGLGNVPLVLAEGTEPVLAGTESGNGSSGAMDPGKTDSKSGLAATSGTNQTGSEITPPAEGQEIAQAGTGQTAGGQSGTTNSTSGNSSGSEISKENQESGSTSQGQGTASGSTSGGATAGSKATSGSNVADGGEDLVLEIIYHGFDKFTIEGEEKEKMDQLILAMRSRPTIRVRLNSHTDSRGSKSYNETLSRQRVEATAAYLKAAGIAAERIEVKWHGESQLINRCGNNVWCPIEEHAKNRRTEIEVITY